MRQTRLDSDRRDRRGGFSKLLRLLAVLVVVLLIAVVALAFLRNPEPEIALEPERPGIGRNATPVTVRLSEPGRGLSAVRLELEQDGEVTVLDERTYDVGPRPFWAFWGDRTAEDEFTVDVGRETVDNLQEGEATLRVVAERPGSLFGAGDPAIAEQTLPVALRPPTISPMSSFHYVAQGGSGTVAYRVSDSALQEGSRDGVRVGDWFFEGFPLPGGDDNQRFAIFGVPWDVTDDSEIRLVAEDPLGNDVEVAFVDRWFPRPPRTNDISLTEDFMNKVVPEIMGQTPELDDQGDLVANYVMINDQLREKNAEQLTELAEQSAEEFYWSEPFLQMPGGQVMSTFATVRSYMFEGEKVDEQTHLGFDLATTRQDEVPAANRGRVVMAEYFGIYGNTVVIDHGYGLMSLYSHLSSFSVAEGDMVERGQTIGRTGETGLAGGDHLHLTFIVDGVHVSPVEWWDAGWIRDRFVPKLGDGVEFDL